MNGIFEVRITFDNGGVLADAYFTHNGQFGRHLVKLADTTNMEEIPGATIGQVWDALVERFKSDESH